MNAQSVINVFVIKINYKTDEKTYHGHIIPLCCF
jgi:hypothetical protein